MQAIRPFNDPRTHIVSAVFPIIALAYLSLSPAPVHAVNDTWQAVGLDTVLPTYWVWPMAHLTAYATLTLTLSRIHWLRRQGAWFALAVIALGLGFEIAQEMGGKRTFEVVDLIANTCGVALAFIILVFNQPREELGG